MQNDKPEYISISYRVRSDGVARKTVLVVAIAALIGFGIFLRLR